MAKNAFTIIAHRGFSSKAPENTIAAFDLAINSGFTNIELDVQLTKDGIPVIIHDAAVDRTTNGSGDVKDFNLLELQKLDAGLWFGKTFADEHIITLKELLVRYADTAHLHIELKSEEPELPVKVVAALSEHKLLDDKHDNLFGVPGITITSFKLEQLKHSHAVLGDRFTHGWLVDGIDEQIIDTAIHYGIQQVCPRAAQATKDSIALAISKGLTVRGQSVKTDADVQLFYDAGAVGTTTNWPDRAKKLLSR